MVHTTHVPGTRAMATLQCVVTVSSATLTHLGTDEMDANLTPVSQSARRHTQTHHTTPQLMHLVS